MERHFALRLTFVLEPYGDRLDFPVENMSDTGANTLISGVTYIPAAFARASRSSRVGCDVLWKSCSSSMS